MIRVLIADGNSVQREQMRAELSVDGEIDIAGLARDGQEALQLAVDTRPDISLLAADLAVTDGFETAELISEAHAGKLASIIYGGPTGEEHLLKAMRAGARMYIPRDAVLKRLLETVRQIHADQTRRQSPEFRQATDPRFFTRVIAMTGAKGGIGKTTLITNLAVEIARITREPTLLIDLYTQFGDVPLLLNLPARKTLYDVASLNESELDEQVLDDCTQTHSSGLNVLYTAKTPVALDALSLDFLENALSLMKRKYRYILLDLPPILNANTLYVVSHATSIILLGNLHDLTTTNDTRLLFQKLASKYVSRDRINVVMSRVDKSNRLRLPDIESTLEHPIAAIIPNDSSIVPRSVNDGEPFVISHKNSGVSKAVNGLARKLCGLPDEAAQTASSKGPRPQSFAGMFMKRPVASEEA